MNYRIIFNTTGRVLIMLAVLLILPIAVALFYKESCVFSLLITMGISAVVGLTLFLVFKPKTLTIFAKEGFITVTFVWLAVSLVGALPFTISGEIPSYIDALFETVSGFTTTGASILNDVESLSNGLLFWRSFTHWIGGMGVIVFIMAITSRAPDRSMHILRAEMPGPIIGKLVPRARDTAKILYIIYIALTALLIIMLLCGGMSFFESSVHAFGAAGTGGFGIKSDSIASYSKYIKWVLTVFMILFGVNFNVYYLIIIGKFSTAFKSSELWVYLGIIIIATLTVAISVAGIYNSFGDTITHSAFQVSSIITTTGFTTTNFDAWPSIAKTILFLLMITGACAGSTGGGLKVSRVIILFKKLKRDLKKALHPKASNVVKFEGKKLEDDTLNGVTTYFAVYMISLLVIVLLLSIDNNITSATAFETNVSSTVACFNNIGPAFAQTGPTLSYATYSPFSKIVLSLAMLMGRLEIYPLLLTLMPTTWIKR